jgi:hypothetical protein
LSEVDRRQLPEFGQGQSERPKTADYFNAPQCLSVKESIVSGAASGRVDEAQVLVGSKRLHRYPSPT